MAIQIVMATMSSNEHWNGDCDYCVVEVSDSYLDKIADRISAFRSIEQSDKMATEIHYVDFQPCWVSSITQVFGHEAGDAFDDLLMAKPEEPFWYGHEIVSSGLRLQGDAARTEADRIEIGGYGVRWSCVPKHSDIDVWTPWITEEHLKVIREELAERSRE